MQHLQTDPLLILPLLPASAQDSLESGARGASATEVVAGAVLTFNERMERIMEVAKAATDVWIGTRSEAAFQSALTLAQAHRRMADVLPLLGDKATARDRLRIVSGTAT